MPTEYSARRIPLTEINFGGTKLGSDRLDALSRYRKKMQPILANKGQKCTE
jgi:hypothetical protein